jgi:hypothetical protein
MTAPVPVWRLPRSARWAMGLWIVLAIAVFSVSFDWQTRVAGHDFVRAQLLRQRQGQPYVTINDGFAPMVRAAARRSAVWLVVIAAGGTTAVIMAARRGQVR